MMEAAFSDDQPSRRMCISGRKISLILLIGIVTLFKQSASAADGTSVGGGSVRAELFHREHPFSQSAKPTRQAGRQLSSNPTDAAAVAGAGSTTWETNVTGAPYEYLMSISLGTPPQNLVAVVDTGSDLNWVQCKPCEECINQTNPVFDPALSSTYQNLSCSSTACSYLLLEWGASTVTSCTPSCEYYYNYFDGTYSNGTISSETITLKSVGGDDITLADVWFGCSHVAVSASDLLDSSDGIVGLSRGPISFSSQLGAVFEDKFSYCLVNKTLAGVQSSPLVFGSEAAPAGVELQYTPILYNEAKSYDLFYYIGVEGISVDGVAVSFNVSALAIDSSGNGGVMVDSGTTWTWLNFEAYDAVAAAVLDSLNNTNYVRAPDESPLKLCYKNVTANGSPVFVSNFPTIGFTLANNTSWDVDGDNAWVISDGSNSICLAIAGQAEGISILGNVHQRNFHVLFDRVEDRIGFAKTDCGAA